jgi:hypothetical protein
MARPLSPAALVERRRQDRLAQIQQQAARCLSGQADVMHVEFHHDPEQHVTIKVFNRPPKGGR